MTGGNPFDTGSAREAGRLVERAQHLGQAGHAGRLARGEEGDPEGFGRLLEEEEKKAAAGEREVSREHPPSEALSEMEERPEPEAGLPVGELEQRTSERGRLELEKRAGLWRGPILTAGLPAVASLGSGLGATRAERGERPRREEHAPAGAEIPPGQARVDPDLVAELRAAGLAHPLAGLDDPRLAGNMPALPAEEGWRNAPAGPNSVLFFWEGAGAYQRLRCSEGSVTLESAAGVRLQILERRGNRVSVRTERREAPPSFPGPPD